MNDPRTVHIERCEGPKGIYFVGHVVEWPGVVAEGDSPESVMAELCAEVAHLKARMQQGQNGDA